MTLLKEKRWLIGGHENVAEVVGATSSDGFLVNLSNWTSKQETTVLWVSLLLFFTQQHWQMILLEHFCSLERLNS